MNPNAGISPQAMEAALQQEYNESQMKALTGGLGGQQVVLIQVLPSFVPHAGPV